VSVDGLPGELDTADLILVTHAHKDHAKRVTLERIKGTTTRVVALLSCVRELDKDITVVEPGAELDFDGIGVRVVHAYNIETADLKKVWHHMGADSIRFKEIVEAGSSTEVVIMEIGEALKIESHLPGRQA